MANTAAAENVFFFTSQTGPQLFLFFPPLWEEVKRQRQDQLLWHLEAGFQLFVAAFTLRTCGTRAGKDQ